MSERANRRCCSLQRSTALIVVALSMAMAQRAGAEIVAHFSGGNGTDQVDQYRGKVGDGWSGAWSNPSAGTLTVNDTVVASDPLNAGGDYLSASLTAEAVGESGYAAWGAHRQYQTYGGVDLTDDHVIRFDFRVDALPTGWGSSDHDRIEIYDHTKAFPNLDDQCSWFAFANGQVSANTSLSGKWAFGDFPGSNTTWDWSTKVVNSDIELAAGTVYSFTITVHPASDTYDVTLTDNGSNTFTTTGLGLRDDSGPHGFLHWTMRVSAQDDIGEFSLDSISIVPEPTSAMTMTCALLWSTLLLLRRHRESRRAARR